MLKLLSSVCGLALLALPAEAQIGPRADSAILPSVRAVAPNGQTTAYGTIVNSGDTTLTACRPTLTGASGVGLVFRKTNAQNQPEMVSGIPADPLPPGALQSFLLTFTVGQQVSQTGQVSFVCNEASAPVRKNVNSFQLNVGSSVPDIIPVLATPTPGVTEITAPGQTAFFAAAAINIGGAGTIDVVPSTTLGDLQADASITVCETNSNAVCLAPPTATVNTVFAAGQTKTFSAFLTQPTNAGTPFMPDAVRVGLTFSQPGATCQSAATTRGLATTAFRSPDPGRGSNLAFGFYRLIFDDVATRSRLRADGYFFPGANKLLATIFRTDVSNVVVGALDATGVTSGGATIFQDARLSLISSTPSGIPGPGNYSVLLGDFASAAFKFAGRMVAGSGASPLPAGREADFRSMVNPFNDAEIVKDNFAGTFKSTQGSLTLTLVKSPAGQPITFSGQVDNATPGGAACQVAGKLTPSIDTAGVYLAETTLTAPAGGGSCSSQYPPGTYDGYATMLEPRPASTTCLGTVVAAQPRTFELRLTPLSRERRTEAPTFPFYGEFLQQQ